MITFPPAPEEPAEPQAKAARRSHLITCRLAPEEHAELQSLAREYRVTSSALLRAALGYGHLPPARTDAKTAAQLGRIGGNLWQLVRLIRAGQSTHDEAVIEALRQEVLELRLTLLQGGVGAVP